MLIMTVIYLEMQLSTGEVFNKVYFFSLYKRLELRHGIVRVSEVKEGVELCVHAPCGPSWTSVLADTSRDMSMCNEGSMYRCQHTRYGNPNLSCIGVRIRHGK
jgi:hypothetical protein